MIIHEDAGNILSLASNLKVVPLVEKLELHKSTSHAHLTRFASNCHLFHMHVAFIFKILLSPRFWILITIYFVFFVLCKIILRSLHLA
jgi:hypothetical protein